MIVQILTVDSLNCLRKIGPPYQDHVFTHLIRILKFRQKIHFEISSKFKQFVMKLSG